MNENKERKNEGTHARVFTILHTFPKSRKKFDTKFSGVDKNTAVCYTDHMKKIKKYCAVSYRPNRVNVLKDFLNDLRPFDLVIQCVKVDEKTENQLQNNKEYINFSALKERMERHLPPPKLVQLSGFDSEREIAELLAPVKPDLEGLTLFKCPDLADLSFLEDFPRLKTLQMYWNRKATKLFNAARLPALQKLYVTDCNKLTDFSGLRGSRLASLTLYGCNGLSSFTPRLDIGDPDFLADMPALKHLTLDIMRTQTNEVYLKTFANLKTLEVLELPRSFFTFEQFAWLSAHLPNVKESLEACPPAVTATTLAMNSIRETFAVIGRHKPCVKAEKAKKYTAAYDALRAQFKDADEPPAVDFKITI